jgi:RNA polymerase sigma-70 factor (ECF subfamily)
MSGDLRYVAAALDGSELALDALAKSWLPTVYRWCHRLAGPGVDAEDAAHEVLIIMCRRIGSVRSERQFPAWLFQTTRRVIANHRRRAWVRRWVPGPVRERPAHWGAPEQTVEAKQAARRVWGILDQLSTRHREILVLCELEEMSSAEVSEMLGIPQGTVKSRLRAARTAFRNAAERQPTQSSARKAAEVSA